MDAYAVKFEVEVVIYDCDNEKDAINLTTMSTTYWDDWSVVDKSKAVATPITATWKPVI